MAKATGKAFKKTKKEQGDPVLTEELIKEVCKYLERGVYVETACVISGLSKSSFYRQMKLSHTKSRTKHAALCRVFRNAVGVAMAKSDVRDILNIDKCAMGSPAEYLKHEEGETDEYGKDISGQHVIIKGKAIVIKEELKPSYQCSMWRLEKRKPKEWGNTVKHIHERENIDEHENEQDNKERMLIQFVDAPEEK